MLALQRSPLPSLLCRSVLPPMRGGHSPQTRGRQGCGPCCETPPGRAAPHSAPAVRVRWGILNSPSGGCSETLRWTARGLEFPGFVTMAGWARHHDQSMLSGPSARLPVRKSSGAPRRRTAGPGSEQARGSNAGALVSQSILVWRQPQRQFGVASEALCGQSEEVWMRRVPA